jgi:hypothetical protein
VGLRFFNPERPGQKGKKLRIAYMAVGFFS